jgi:hypothetical protein
VSFEIAPMSTELERGDIFFSYRPRVGIEEVRSLQDVQRFFFVLPPDGDARLREVIVGTKRLPEVQRHERAWAFVARVTDSAASFREELGRRTYQTKTRGERLQPETRPAGEGRYAIVDHHGHSHLACALELPQEPGEAQRALGSEPQGSYIVAVRNPDAPTPPGIELVVIGAARAAARELGIELDAEDERIHDADLFQALRVAPDELPVEPLRSGRLS